MRAVAALLIFSSMPAMAEPKVIELPGKSQLVTIRFVFSTGPAFDPADKPGLANLTAAMLGSSGTKDLTYKQIVDAMYPMAADVSAYSDKEMTTFVGETHVDNLDKFYALMRDMVLHPGWRAEDFARARDNTVNGLRVALRGNNDEELGKEELYNLIYQGRPYGHENMGTVSALGKMTIPDLRAFYKQQYTQANLTIGSAGGYPPGFVARVKKDFAELPAGKANGFEFSSPAALTHNQVTIIQKDTRSVAWSLGFPLDVKRGDPDYPALLVMQSWLGQHRLGGRLFQRMREVRGLNYGDYDYIEYFPGGMFRFEPPPNIARHQQIFQIWIRPVEPPTAVFSLRLAIYELDRMVKTGLTEAEFQQARSFVSKYIDVLTKTKSAELGYAIDSAYYGIPGYNNYVKGALAKMSLADVNGAIRRHLRAENLQIAGVAGNADQIRAALISGDPSPIQYNSPKPQEVMDEDKIVQNFPLHLRAEDVHVVPVATVFEN